MLRTTQVWQKAKGYRQNPNLFLGSPQRVWMRYKFQNEQLKFSFLYEKDPGESFSWKHNHHNMAWQIKVSEKFQKIIIGDFNLKFGQGLGL